MTDECNSITPAAPAELMFPMGIDDYSDIQLSEGAKNKLANILISSRAGLVSSSPLLCKGPTDCPFKSRCPIYTEDGAAASFPIGKQCIVELNFIQDRFMSYAEELNAGGKVTDSLTYRSQISALVDLDLREFRTVQLLAGVGDFSDGTMLYENTIALNEEGEEVKQLQEHPAFKNLVRIRKDRMDLLDAMGLTVKRKAMIDAALKRKDTDNFLTKSIELLERVALIEENMTEGK